MVERLELVWVRLGRARRGGGYRLVGPSRFLLETMDSTKGTFWFRGEEVDDPTGVNAHGPVKIISGCCTSASRQLCESDE